MIVHTDTTYCDTNTHTYTHSGDHSIPLGYKSPGRTSVQLQHPSCSPLLLPSLFSSLQLVLIQKFVSPVFSYSLSLLTLSPPFWTPPPPGYLFHSGRYIPSLTVKSLWRSMCAAWLSVLSHGMMESSAYLSYSSSCFAICLMYSRPLESNQYSTSEQIAVKP